MKLITAALILFSFQTSFGSEITTQVAPDHSSGRWYFFGCTHDNHECHDLVHDYGYSVSRTVHGSSQCHHGDEDHACYGRQ